MEGFVKWVSEHVLTSLLIAVTAYAIWYIAAHYKSLFYKE